MSSPPASSGEDVGNLTRFHKGDLALCFLPRRSAALEAVLLGKGTRVRESVRATKVSASSLPIRLCRLCPFAACCVFKRNPQTFLAGPETFLTSTGSLLVETFLTFLPAGRAFAKAPELQVNASAPVKNEAYKPRG